MVGRARSERLPDRQSRSAVATTPLFTEPDADPDTLRNLGPLAPLAGSWFGDGGLDVHPTADGPVQSAFVERYDLKPIDPQTNGPQLFYGLRYHTHITQPGETATFHNQGEIYERQLAAY